MTTIYICTGTCSGVSPLAKNCGAESCTHFNQPLQARNQCAACLERSEKEGKPVSCGECSPV